MNWMFKTVRASTCAPRQLLTFCGSMQARYTVTWYSTQKDSQEPSVSGAVVAAAGLMKALD